MKKIYLFLFFITICHFSIGQNVTYEYDDAGNRIKRISLPDLTPSILNDGTSILQGGIRDNVIIITNLGAKTTAPITVNIPKMLPNFNIIIPPSASSMDVFGGYPVENIKWDIVEQATRYVLTSKAGIVIPTLGTLAIGIQISAVGIPQSSGNFTVRVVFGSGGGETPTTNNDDINTYTIN